MSQITGVRDTGARTFSQVIGYRPPIPSTRVGGASPSTSRPFRTRRPQATPRGERVRGREPETEQTQLPPQASYRGLPRLCRPARLEHRDTSPGGGLWGGATRGSRKTARCCAPPGDRYRSGLAARSLGQVGDGPSGNASLAASSSCFDLRWPAQL